MQNIQAINDLCIINNISHKTYSLDDTYINNNITPIIDLFKKRKKLLILETIDYLYIVIKIKEFNLFGPFEKDNLIIYDNAKLLYCLLFNKPFNQKNIEMKKINFNLENINFKDKMKKVDLKKINIMNFLEDSIKNGDIESTKIYVKILFQSLISENNFELFRLQKNLVIYIFCYIFNSIDNNNIDPDFNIFLTSIITSEFEFCDNSSQLLFKTNQLLDKINDSFEFTSIKNNQNIKEAKYFINNNLEKKLTLEKVANEMGISAKYLSTLFFEITNTTFKEYVNRQRIDKAKNLLLYSEKSISEISKEIGIKSPNNFISFFKKYTSSTPNNYREQNYLTD